MKLANCATFLAGCGLASATCTGGLSRRDKSLFKRWDYDVCFDDCTLAGVAMPDKDNFQLPLENNWSEQCPPIYVGDPKAPQASSRVCLDFIGPNIYFNVAPFPGYSTKSATVTWKLMGNMLDEDNWASPPPTASIDCVPAASGDDLVCKLPFSDILGVSPSTSIKDIMAGMCPNGDREGLGFYFQFSGEVAPVDDPATVLPFNQGPPCTTRDGDRKCTAWNTCYNYIEVSYRCSKCDVPECTTPPPVVCGFGTAFGYQSPVGGAEKSIKLNTQSGQGCNRWGWYETPTIAELQGGISGPLYVGAGGNDISKATNVGIWVATANAAGRVTVTYLLEPPYSLSEVHVDLACLPIDKCAPGSYTYKADDIPNLPTWSNPTPLLYPTCSGGSKAALIIHAAVDELTTSTTCGPPKAT